MTLNAIQRKRVRLLLARCPRRSLCWSVSSCTWLNNSPWVALETTTLLKLTKSLKGQDLNSLVFSPGSQVGSGLFKVWIASCSTHRSNLFNKSHCQAVDAVYNQVPKPLRRLQ